MWAQNWNNNWNNNINNNDKIYRYWKKSIDNIKNNSISKNTIKISDFTDHNNKYTVQITKFNNGKTFIKEFKLLKQDLDKILNSNLKNYKIINNNSNNCTTEENRGNINYHHEYRNNIDSIHRSSYQSSFNMKSYNS